MWSRRTEAVLLGIGIVSALLSGAVAILSSEAARASQGVGRRRMMMQGAAGSAASATVSSSADTHLAGGAYVIGKLEIPALSLSVPILSDYQVESLLQGVGHVPGTAMPGGLGTLGLAGHRDTYFRPLKNIRRNMDIRVSGPGGTYHYIVDRTEIVDPDNVSVLDIGGEPELTLITCYPFYYVGAAPKRFIVHAHLLSASPDDVPSR